MDFPKDIKIHVLSDTWTTYQYHLNSIFENQVKQVQTGKKKLDAVISALLSLFSFYRTPRKGEKNVFMRAY